MWSYCISLLLGFIFQILHHPRNCSDAQTIGFQSTVKPWKRVSTSHYLFSIFNHDIQKTFCNILFIVIFLLLLCVKNKTNKQTKKQQWTVEEGYKCFNPSVQVYVFTVKLQRILEMPSLLHTNSSFNRGFTKPYCSFWCDRTIKPHHFSSECIYMHVTLKNVFRWKAKQIFVLCHHHKFDLLNSKLAFNSSSAVLSFSFSPTSFSPQLCLFIKQIYKALALCILVKLRDFQLWLMCLGITLCHI